MKVCFSAAILASVVPRGSAALFSKSEKIGKAFNSKTAKHNKSVAKNQHVDQPHKLLSPKPKSGKGDPKAKAAKEPSKSGKSKTSKYVKNEGEATTTTSASPANPVVQPQPKSGAQWFLTSHPDYMNIVNNEANQDIHPHMLAGLFCHTQSLFLCTYNDYCPSGRGSDPYTGGDIGPHINPGSVGPVNQWAPMYSDDVSYNGSLNDWVQVGEITYGEEEDEEHGKCWSYNDWTRGSGGDIVDVWNMRHRNWILCCEKESEKEKREMGH